MRYEPYIDNYGFFENKIDNSGTPLGAGDNTFFTSWMAFADMIHQESFMKDHIAQPKKFTETFLASFARHCIKKDYLEVHPVMHIVRPNNKQPFSRDQLSPLLLAIASVIKYGNSTSNHYAKEIVKAIVRFDNRDGNVAENNHRNGKINDHMRIVIDQLARHYKIAYSRKPNKNAMAITLWLYANYHVYGVNKVQRIIKWLYPSGINLNSVIDVFGPLLPKDIKSKFKKIGHADVKKMLDQVDLNAYTIFNNLALFQAHVLLGGDKSLKKYFKPFAKYNTGLVYKIVSGLRYNQKEFDKYQQLKQNVLDYITQRGNFKQAKGDCFVLDYPILKSFEILWR